MADFVAVIRRAVDGLTDNSPEMRVKVYDKARGAVRRQLEAMNPRPSDELVQRQLDKLENAISEVEGDHAEALPAEAEFVEDSVEAAETQAAAPVQEPEPVQDPEPVQPGLTASEPSREEQPAYQEQPAPEDAPYAAPVAATPAEPAYEEPATEEPTTEEPAYAEPAYEEPAHSEPSHEEPAGQPMPAVEPEVAYETPERSYAEDRARESELPASVVHPVEPAAEPSWSQEPAITPAEPVASEETAHPDAAAEPVPADNPTYIGLEPVDDPAYDHTAFTEHAETAARDGADEPQPVGSDAFPSEPEQSEQAYLDWAQSEAAAPAEPTSTMPAATNQWGWTDTPATPAAVEPSHAEISHDVREDVAREEVTQDVEQRGYGSDVAPEWTWPDDARAAEPAPEQKKTPDNAWSDLEDLIGYQPKTEEAASPVVAEDTPSPSDATEAAVRSGQRPFRAEPRKRRVTVGRIAAVIALLAVIGGAGAAYWLNREEVDRMLAELTAPAAPAPSETSQADGSATPAATGAGGQGQAAQTPVASADAGSSKFTQRLLADGTEADDGPAPLAAGAESQEGKSVAEQTTELASADPAAPVADGAPTVTEDAAPDATVPNATAPGAAVPGATAPGDATQNAATAPTATPPGGTAPGTPPATGTAAQAPLGVTQKMFIYEERLGQSAPTAIDGTIVWSQAEESPGGDARPEPVIRGQLTAGSDGLTAQLTIRRNADKSLPASHLVEIVFALPPNFEGGNIDNVQRVAMKRTEQDRGDPLIAVPAKITEDFHMIALNDFPDAISRNTELLKTRDWIDIPITYRNGRRALITLEKGASGAEVFNNVMNAWTALGPAADSQ